MLIMHLTFNILRTLVKDIGIDIECWVSRGTTGFPSQRLHGLIELKELEAVRNKKSITTKHLSFSLFLSHAYYTHVIHFLFLLTHALDRITLDGFACVTHRLNKVAH